MNPDHIAATILITGALAWFLLAPCGLALCRAAAPDAVDVANEFHAECDAADVVHGCERLLRGEVA